MSVKATEKVILQNYKRGTSEKSGLDYEIVEKVVLENYVSQISIQELIDKLNGLASSKDTMVMVEVLGILRTPSVLYAEGSFEAYIETRETDEGIEETFRLIDHSEEVGNLEFSIFDVEHNVIWDRWSGYFLVKFLENDLELMISYHNYKLS